MFGIGGGLVIVPVLVMLFGLTQKAATGTSLFALLMPVGLLGVLEYRRRQEIRLDYGLLIALGLFAGAYFGARLTDLVSDRHHEANLCPLPDRRGELLPDHDLRGFPRPAAGCGAAEVPPGEP
jgi:hypothetical protein